MAICCKFYNDLAGIKRLVESADDFFIIFVDGKWKNWPGESIESDDGSRQYIESLANVSLIGAVDMVEYQSRNLYFLDAQRKKFEYCLIMDSDEYVDFADFAMIDKELNRGYDSFRHTMRQDKTDVFPHNKLCKSLAHHRDDHRRAYIGFRQIFDKNARIIRGLITTHDKSLRDEKRQLMRKQYYKDNPIR